MALLGAKARLAPCRTGVSKTKVNLHGKLGHFKLAVGQVCRAL